MKRNTDRILITHAGSLARPPGLREMVVRKSRSRTHILLFGSQHTAQPRSNTQLETTSTSHRI